MRDLLRRSDVLEVIADFRKQLLLDHSAFPKDLALEHKLSVIDAVENRILLLSRGGIRVIEGGKQ